MGNTSSLRGGGDYALEGVFGDGRENAVCGSPASRRGDGGTLQGVRHRPQDRNHALAKGTPSKAPFPRKSYFRPLMGELLKPVLNPSPKCYSTLIAKTREMLTSWTICLYLGWLCQWRPGTTAVVQTLKEAKAAELIRYVSILTENQEPFL